MSRDFTFEKNGLKATVSSECSDEEILRVIKLVNGALDNKNEVKEENSESRFIEFKPQERPEKRERLPFITSNVMCPVCGNKSVFEIYNSYNKAAAFKPMFNKTLFVSSEKALKDFNAPLKDKSSIEDKINLYNNIKKSFDEEEKHHEILKAEFISDSDSPIVCGFCGCEDKISRFIKTFTDNLNLNTCQFCGGELDTVINKFGIEEIECTKNNCLRKLKEKSN